MTARIASNNVLAKLAALSNPVQYPAKPERFTHDLQTGEFLTVEQRKADRLVSNPQYDRSIVCKWCGDTAGNHFDQNGTVNTLGTTKIDFATGNLVPACNRDRFEVGNVETSYESRDLGHFTRVDTDAYGYAIEANPEQVESFDAWEQVFDSADNFDAIDNYRDQHPDLHTFAIAWKHVDANGQAARGTYALNAPQRENKYLTAPPVNESHSVYVEGHDGFLTFVAYDEHLTELFQNRMLNIYTDKRSNRLRIGGMQFVHCTDGTINAECVQNGCSAKLNSKTEAAMVADTPVPFSIEHSKRDWMEKFTTAVIRHGNNHAARWFTTRTGNYSETRFIESSIPANCHQVVTKSVPAAATFYKLHAENCNLGCDPKAATCNVTHKVAA